MNSPFTSTELLEELDCNFVICSVVYTFTRFAEEAALKSGIIEKIESGEYTYEILIDRAKELFNHLIREQEKGLNEAELAILIYVFHISKNTHAKEFILFVIFSNIESNNLRWLRGHASYLMEANYNMNKLTSEEYNINLDIDFSNSQQPTKSGNLTFKEQQREALIAKTNSIRYQETNIDGNISPHEIILNKDLIAPVVNPKHPYYKNQYEPFDLEYYQYPTPPIDLGNSNLTFDSIKSPNVLRMPIKFPNTKILIPQELISLKDFIIHVLEYEAGINKRIDECFIHITTDKNKIQRNTTHRYPGFHGDGVQGSKFSQKTYTPIEHSYILTSSPPTEFCIQPYFFSHLNDARNNIFHEMELQSREANIFKTLPWHFYLIDPYMVHRTPNITEDCERVFIRITISYTELMNPHNTHNPHFHNYPQKYNERHDIRKFLTTYSGDVPWPMYGLSEGPKSR